MFDKKLRPVINPPLNKIAQGCVSLGLNANLLTVIGFGFGIICVLFIALGHVNLALICLLLNRLFDGLDGAVARIQGTNDFGGYLDIVCDFLFYAMVPFAFMILDETNATAAGFLMLSFVGTGTSFLAYAIIEAKTGQPFKEKDQSKSFYYLGGLTEGAETIGFFVLILLFPVYFSVAAWLFGSLCLWTTATRIYAARRDFA